MQGLNPLTMQCIYSTPCGYCTKWNKKCDKKIGGYPTVDPTDKAPKSHAQKTIDYIKSGKGLPPIFLSHFLFHLVQYPQGVE